MKSTPLINMNDSRLVARGYDLGLKIAANTVNVFTVDDLEYWEANLGKIKEALARGFALENIPALVPVVATPAFSQLNEFELVVPADYQHDGYLGRLRKDHDRDLTYFHSAMTDKNYSRPTRIIKPGERFLIKLVAVLRQVSSEECQRVYREHVAYYTGAQGAGLLYQHKRGELPVGKFTLSFDEEERLPVVVGYHSVPDVYRHSAEHFELGLGSIEKPWHDDFVLALFCDLPPTAGKPLGA